MKYQATAPKERKSNKTEARTYSGRYVGRILTGLAQERVERDDNHVWSGYLSPSNSLAWDMCMDEVYDRMCKPMEVAHGLELIMFMGRAMHEAFKYQSRYMKEFHYDFRNNIRPEFENWQKKAWPEAVGSSNISGWVFKADSVLIDDDGSPIVVDLKTCYQAAFKWSEFVDYNLPKQKDVVQACIYADQLEYIGLLPKVSKVGLEYFNVTNSNLVRGQLQHESFYWPFDLVRYETRRLVYLCARHRRWLLLGERRPCDNPACDKHGKEESQAMYEVRKYCRRAG
jgi:hypothetical protein